MKRVALSKRMQAVADLVPSGFTAADIGCDHGFVSVYLAGEGICPHVWAADVRRGPLDRAREHIAASGLEQKITAVLSDGLKNIPSRPEGGPEGVLIAGMGGKLMARILADAPEKTSALSWCVLAPQSEVWLARRELESRGFFIVRERMVEEDGKFYPVMLGLGPEERWSIPVGEARLRRRELDKRMERAGLDERARQAAMDWLGAEPVSGKDAVLFSFLEHTIRTDEALLAGLSERTDTARSADGERERRMQQRCLQLQERLQLARQVRELMSASAQG
ncbi:MAG: class I SAM-dependent methyltransferase [Eubacteriales bacterium]|nr:class I SAM-dependent methyltransferase [Eubacteriales bacterium]